MGGQGYKKIRKSYGKTVILLKLAFLFNELVKVPAEMHNAVLLLSYLYF